MSIIDWLIMFAMFTAWLIVAAVVMVIIGLIAVLRWWFRSLNVDDHIDTTSPRVRTHLLCGRRAISIGVQPIANMEVRH